MSSSSSLIDRFTYGNTPRYSVQEQFITEVLVESPIRQGKLITLAQKQIEAQKVAAHAIAASNITGAQIVAAQIEQQTLQMQQAFEQVGESLSRDILSSAEHVSFAIEKVGSALTMELTEIRWQMAQQNETLERILYVLRENRSNEARQLVSQGVQHYISEQYDKAEERFRRALDFDTTDYQVLMNLGYIELHRDNADAAFSFFKDALSLPKVQDNSSTSRALWVMARLFYAQGEYQKALVHAEESLKYDGHDPKHLFTCGVYAALSGKHEKALGNIHDAISVEPGLFTPAAVEPDLEPIRDDVVSLLSSMSQSVLSSAVKQDEHIKMMLEQLDRNDHNRDYQAFITKIRTMYSEIHERLHNPSYTECLHCIDELSRLESMLDKALAIIPRVDQEIGRIKQLWIERQKKKSYFEEQDYLYQSMKAEYERTYRRDKQSDNFTMAYKHIGSLILAYFAVTGLWTVAVGFAGHIVIAILMGVLFWFIFFLLIGVDVLKTFAVGAKKKVNDQGLDRERAERAMNDSSLRLDQAEAALLGLLSTLEKV